MNISEVEYDLAPQELVERFRELEDALMGWIPLEHYQADDFSREGIRRITEQARVNAIKNPLIRRGVRIQSYYVFGRGITIAAKDDLINEVVQAFLDDENNQSELTSPQSRKERDKELRIDGNLFFCLFVHPLTGKVRIGFLPFDEITEVIRDPNNKRKPLYYKREWIAESVNLTVGATERSQKVVYYADFRNTNPVVSIGEHAVDQTCVVYHVKTGGSANWAFGISEIYAAIDWAQAYRKFLQDFAKVISTLARFAATKKTSGGASGVAAAKAKLNSTFAQNANQMETNPSPVAGSIYIDGGDGELTPWKTAGTTTRASEGKELRLMSGIAMDLPDHIASGDMAQGTLATAKSLDRPTEFTFVDRQELWVGIYKTILNFVIYHAVAAPSGPLRGLGSLSENEYGETIVVFPDNVQTTIEVDFPGILEQDSVARMDTIIKGSTFDGKTPSVIPDVRFLAKQVLTDWGIDDIDELLDQWYPEGTVEDQEGAPTMAQVQEAIHALKEAVKAFNDRDG